MAVMIRFLQMNNELLLLSGNDIPFIAAGITLHPLTMREIALIGEETFFTGCELLKFSKDILVTEDKVNLSNYSDFQILMSIMNDNSVAMQHNVSSARMVLDLLFPLYTVTISPMGIICLQNDEVQGAITEKNFDEFKQLLKQVFCLDKTSTSEEYDPTGELAKKIANKFKKRKQQLAELKQKPEKVAILSRYISILAVGEHKDINTLMNYTVYQLFDEFQRFELKRAYDMNIKARLAGAKDVQEPEDWTKDIHDGSKSKNTN